MDAGMSSGILSANFFEIGNQEIPGTFHGAVALEDIFKGYPDIMALRIKNLAGHFLRVCICVMGF